MQVKKIACGLQGHTGDVDYACARDRQPYSGALTMNHVSAIINSRKPCCNYREYLAVFPL